MCHVRKIIKKELVEIELEGETEFQKEKCERVFDGKDDKVFLSKTVAHFFLNREHIKRARRKKGLGD